MRGPRFWPDEWFARLHCLDRGPQFRFGVRSAGFGEEKMRVVYQAFTVFREAWLVVKKPQPPWMLCHDGDMVIGSDG